MSGERVVVVGGGLAGITAAIELARRGIPVTLLEARPWLGGATWSFGRRGLTIDNGQHAVLRCFTAYQDLLTTLGVAADVTVQERLDITAIAADGPRRIRRTGWPAPLHLAKTLAGYRGLGPAARLAVLPAIAAMWLSDLSGAGHADVNVADWLRSHGQGVDARNQLWDAVLVPALNAAPAQADLSTAASLINAVLLTTRDGADLGVPAVPLRELHAAPAARLLAELGAEVRLGTQATAIRCAPGGGYAVSIDAGTDPGPPAQLSPGPDGPESITAAGVVLAVPAWAAAPLAPPELAAQTADWQRLEPSPVVSVHIMYDAVVTDMPFAISTDTPLRWVADKTRAAGLRTGQYLAATVPAADDYVDLPSAAIRAELLPVLERMFPAAQAAHVEEFFVTRERRATFRPAPGSAALRPDQQTDLPAFALAGAWTRTGWPDTLEGAVRSGHLAAQSVLAVLAPDQDQAGTAQARRRRLAQAVASLRAALPASRVRDDEGVDAEWVRALADRDEEVPADDSEIPAAAADPAGPGPSGDVAAEPAAMPAGRASAGNPEHAEAGKAAAAAGRDREAVGAATAPTGLARPRRAAAEHPAGGDTAVRR